MVEAEPVLVGMRFWEAERARRTSLLGLSTTLWVLVMQCNVVIMP